MVLALGFMMLVSLVIGAALSAFGQSYGRPFGGWESVLLVVSGRIACTQYDIVRDDLQIHAARKDRLERRGHRRDRDCPLV